jgi:hypothetical protein
MFACPEFSRKVSQNSDFSYATTQLQLYEDKVTGGEYEVIIRHLTFELHNLFQVR